MNEKKFLSYLKQYHQWLVAHQEKATEELAEREAHAKEKKMSTICFRHFGLWVCGVTSTIR